VVALLTHANNAIVHTTGWPIGVVLENSPELKPRPTSEGIFVEIGSSFETYDYWALKLDGSFYLLRSLFEDDKYNVAANVLFFDTRITQVTEAFLYCYRLLTRLGIPPTSCSRKRHARGFAGTSCGQPRRDACLDRIERYPLRRKITPTCKKFWAKSKIIS
jgi:hypothetical protein